MSGRVVVVSGGGTGMGRAVARSFAAIGDGVVIVGRRASVLSAAADALNAEAGTDAVSWHAADLSVPAEVEPLAAAIGDVDVLVNNAGGVDRSDPASLDEVREAWERDLATNVLTAALLTTVLEPRLRRPGGRVVNVSSIAALRGGGDSYSAAKAALIGWTFQLATALGPDGITANVVAPGFVEDTEFFGDHHDLGTPRAADRPDARGAGRAAGGRGRGGHVPRIARGLVRHRAGPAGERRRPPGPVAVTWRLGAWCNLSVPGACHASGRGRENAGGLWGSEREWG